MDLEGTDEGGLQGFHEGVSQLPEGFLACKPARSPLTRIAYAHDFHSRESMAVLTYSASQTGCDLWLVSDPE